MNEPKPFTKEWNELVAKLEAQLEKKLTLTIKRNGEPMTLTNLTN